MQSIEQQTSQFRQLISTLLEERFNGEFIFDSTVVFPKTDHDSRCRVNIWGSIDLEGAVFALNGVRCELGEQKRGGYTARLSETDWRAIINA